MTAASRPPADPARPLRVLVTGGAGFVGAAACRALLSAGAEVLALDDLSSGRLDRLPAHPRLGFRREAVEAVRLAALLADQGPFDHLLHLAARVGVKAVLADPVGCREENEQGVEAVIEALACQPRDRRPRLFFASSSEVYRESPRPLAEGDPLRGEESGRWAYAASKLAGERRIDAAAELWPAERGPVHLRLFNVVGPGQDAAGGMVLPTFVACALAGEPLPVHGDGRALRTFACVQEVADRLSRLCAHPALPPGPLNLGGQARASVHELARLVLRLSGSKAGIAWVDPRERCGRDFEEVLWREPDLGRLAGLGIRPPARALEPIVAECLAAAAAGPRPDVLAIAAERRTPAIRCSSLAAWRSASSAVTPSRARETSSRACARAASTWSGCRAWGALSLPGATCAPWPSCAASSGASRRTCCTPTPPKPAPWGGWRRARCRARPGCTASTDTCSRATSRPLPRGC
jgi:UDP-glucose 4-epimerase